MTDIQNYWSFMSFVIFRGPEAVSDPMVVDRADARNLVKKNGFAT